MGKLAEYIKLLPEGIKNLSKVIEGIKNQVKMELGTISEEDLEIITGRRLICSTCPFNSKNAVAKGFYRTDREDEHCIHCGCPLDTRTVSLESNCGIEKYNELNPKTPLALKWKKVK